MNEARKAAPAAAVLFLWTLLPGATLAKDDEYRAQIEHWRQGREAGLKADGGWLTVAGLFWLKEGTNRFGSEPGGDIVLPADSAPAKAGVFERRGDEVTVRVEPGAPILANGRPVSRMKLRSDRTGNADVLTLGALRMHVIARGDRLGIRLKDMNSALRKEFTGLRWYPVDEAYRITARFVPYRELVPITVPNILGQTEKMPSPGYAIFEKDGKQCRLEGVFEEPGATELFFIFKDETSGKDTYPSGRFLYSELPKGGQLVLDFNRAYNPPCAFTPYATCPLPPPQNVLALRVEAGELNYGKHR